MTRNKVPGSRRVLIGLKVSEDMAARIDQARGELSRADWLRAAAEDALAAGQVGEDWERRAREAGETLARIAELLPTPGASRRQGTPSSGSSLRSGGSS